MIICNHYSNLKCKMSTVCQQLIKTIFCINLKLLQQMIKCKITVERDAFLKKREKFTHLLKQKRKNLPVFLILCTSTGCPKKNYTLFWRAVAPLNFELGIKVGGVLEFSGSQSQSSPSPRQLVQCFATVLPPNLQFRQFLLFENV